MNRRPLRQFAVLMLLLGSAMDASALSCTITASDVVFGGVDPLAGVAVDVSATVQIECSELISPLLDNVAGVCIYLDAGDGGSDGTTYRHMRQGAEILPFNLYKDAARTQIWGSETAFPASGAQRVLVTLTGNLPATGSATVPVYGRIPGTVSDRPVGAYLSTFAGGARARYSYTDAIDCDGVTGTQASDTFTASASIISTCAVEADDLDFGNRSQLNATTDATSQIRTSCSAGLPYSVAVGSGGGASFDGRHMVHDSFPAEVVNYQLYFDFAHSQVWGDGSGGTVTGGDTGSGSPQAATVHGRVPLQTTPRPGDYQDTVIVTVSY